MELQVVVLIHEGNFTFTFSIYRNCRGMDPLSPKYVSVPLNSYSPLHCKFYKNIINIIDVDLMASTLQSSLLLVNFVFPI